MKIKWLVDGQIYDDVVIDDFFHIHHAPNKVRVTHEKGVIITDLRAIQVLQEEEAE